MASYKDLLSMTPQEVQALNKAELSKVVAQLNRIEHKRITNLEKYGLEGPALTTLKSAGGQTRAGRDMSINELRSEYKRAKSFLQSETSTVQGAKNFYKGIYENIGGQKSTGQSYKEWKATISGDDIGRIYSVLNKAKEAGYIDYYKKGNKGSAGYKQSYDAQKDIFKYINEGLSDDEILIKLGAEADSDYESKQDTSTDFKWGGDYRP